MPIRSRLPARVPLDMTAMIDIVFQLLIFFILTLQISEQEGELDVSLPRLGKMGAPPPDFTPPLFVVLRAGKQGELAELSLSGRPLASMAELHAFVERLVAEDPLLSQSGSAILQCDDDLAYEHTIAAVTAISGSRQSDGTIRPLIQNVSFGPAR